MTENEIYASALRDIVGIIDLHKADGGDMFDRLVNIRYLAYFALVDGTTDSQGDAHLNAQRIENARLRALAI